jgi:hypothetical protein
MSEPGDGEQMLVELTRATDLFEARLLAGFLESEGFRAFIPGEEMITALDGAATIWSAGVPVEVRSEDLEKAREALAAWRQRDG